MSSETAERFVEIPKDVKVELNGRKVTVAGPRGSVNEDLSHMPVAFEIKNGKVLVRSSGSRRRDRAMTGTAAAHIANMVRGVTDGFVYKLKIVYAHFPVTVKVHEKEKKVSIENFGGEKTPRFASIVGEAKVKVSGDEITVEGTRLDEVSRTASNIEQATKIKDKDQRVFLDGIYIFQKGRGAGK
jgi:large subunit ribosomal protein L6